MAIAGVGLLLLTCLCVGVGLRIYSVNEHSLSVPVERYGIGENINLEGAFITSSKEKTQGYSIVVNGVRMLSHGDYLERYGKGNGAAGDEKTILEIEVSIRNEGNSQGYLDVNGWRVVPERGNEYFVVNNSLWQLGEPNAPGETGGLSLVPDSEYTVSIPFVRNTGDEDMFAEGIGDTTFSLVVSDAPVRKEVAFCTDGQ